MRDKILRRLASVGAVLALIIASSPRLDATPQSSGRAAAVAGNLAPSQAAVEATGRAPQTGEGWGAMIACAGCLVGAGVIVAGGPAAIIVAANLPGSAIAAMACVAVCYEAFQ